MIFPVRMRRRLTIAFIPVAAVSAAMLATGSYFLARHHRVQANVDQALQMTRLNLEGYPRER